MGLIIDLHKSGKDIAIFCKKEYGIPKVLIYPILILSIVIIMYMNIIIGGIKKLFIRKEK